MNLQADFASPNEQKVFKQLRQEVSRANYRNISRELSWWSSRRVTFSVDSFFGIFSNMDPEKLPSTIVVNAALSVVGFGVTVRLIPGLKDMFLKANLSGVDMSKKDKQKM